MKAVILAGGLGTRLSEETVSKPKPMVEIGGKPILWHVMKIYSHYGIDEFVICLGYKGYLIKEYFANYLLHTSDVTIDVRENTLEIHQAQAEPWRVTLVDTGDHTMTGGRLRRIRRYIEGNEFCLTYGDGLGSVDIGRLIEFHRAHGKSATVTATQMPGRFGALSLDEDKVSNFEEKPVGGGGWINGGFFVLSPNAVDYVEDDFTVWEKGPMENLARDGELMAYQHKGFWQPMDTLRDKNYLNTLWESGNAPWMVWS